ncbi:MAG: PTS fructose transporter subunit IIA [Pirellulaceae bacterium]|nr:MAG: PTS fructose transporter subunit IIA [Pirellulaceae bacterium]
MLERKAELCLRQCEEDHRSLVMADQDFDIDSLARYLHLSPAVVLRMAERGQLPGRKVRGQWKFDPSEIHHWLEERIGASEEEELVQVEEALDKSHQQSEPIIISELLPVEAIEPRLPARTRNSVIEAMTNLAARTGKLWDPVAMAAAVRARESLHSTALENGVALLHPRRPQPSLLAEPILALGRTVSGIPFGGPTGCLTDLFFLICSVQDAQHLRTLARLSRLLAREGFVAQLRDAPDAPSMWHIIRQFESELDTP